MAYLVALGSADLPDAPALAVLLLDAQPERLKPLLTGCHEPNVRKKRQGGLRTTVGQWFLSALSMSGIVSEMALSGCITVHLTPCLGCAMH